MPLALSQPIAVVNIIHRFQLLIDRFGRIVFHRFCLLVKVISGIQTEALAPETAGANQATGLLAVQGDVSEARSSGRSANFATREAGVS